MKLAHAFSLIELMVVIAIVAILVAVAVPSYKRYVITEKITDSFNVANNLRQQLITQFESTGSFPASISFGGATLNNIGNYGFVGIGPTENLRYLSCPGFNAVYVEAALTGIDGVSSSYVASPSGGAGTNPSIRITSILGSNGVYTTYCGLWTPTDATSIPLASLPAQCTCTNLNTICGSGTVSNPC